MLDKEAIFSHKVMLKVDPRATRDHLMQLLQLAKEGLQLTGLLIDAEESEISKNDFKERVNNILGTFEASQI